MSLETFKRLVDQHDLTYSYSDDIRSWRRGQEQYDQIKALAAKLPQDEVTKIWNERVDRSISPGHRDPFYWRAQ